MDEGLEVDIILTEHATEEAELKRYFNQRLSISEEHYAVCTKQLIDDSKYLFENVIHCQRYVLGLTKEAFQKRLVRSLCPCATKVSEGHQHSTTNRVRQRSTMVGAISYETPFYDVYLVNTVSLALCVFLRCRDCRVRKNITTIPRNHVLQKDASKYDWFVEWVTRHVFQLRLRTTIDPIWPCNRQTSQEYPKETENMLDQNLITIHSDERFVSSLCLPLVLDHRRRPDTLFVQSPCGSGKSKFGVAYISRLYDMKLIPNGVFLPVATKAQASAHVSSFTKAYPEWVFPLTHPSRIGILHYKNSQKTVSEGCALRDRGATVSVGDLSSICTINSMVQQYTYRDRYGQLKIHVPSFVWIDEIVSVLDALTMSEHMRSVVGGRVRAIKVFEHIVANCTFLLCTDAFLNTECVQYIQEIRKNKKTEIVQFNSRYRLNTVHVYQNKEAEFLHHLAEAVKANKRVFVLSDSKSFASKAHDGVIEIDELQKKFKYYSADTADDVKDHDFSHCTDVWMELDGLFSTPTLTTGVDFTNLHFHMCFVYATGMSITARTNMQMIIRVRQYIDAEIHAYLPTRQTFRFPLDKQEEAEQALSIVESRDYEKSLSSDILGIFHVTEEHCITKAPIASLAVSYAREHDDSRRDYASEFVRLSRFCGYTVYLCVPSQNTTPEDDLDPITANSENMQIAHKELEDTRYIELATMPMPDELPQQIRGKKLSEDANKVLKLYKLRKSIGTEYDYRLQPNFIKQFYDKTVYFDRMRFIGYLCEITDDYNGYIDDFNEPEFMKRLKSSSTYFVKSLKKISEMMDKYGMLDYTGPVQRDMMPFAFSIQIPIQVDRRELDEEDAAHIKQFFMFYCKQFCRPTTKDDYKRSVNMQTLKVLYSAAMTRFGVQVRQTPEKAGYKYKYSIKPSVECELYIAKMCNLKKRGKVIPCSLQMLSRLAHFTRHGLNHKLAWDSAHGFTDWLNIYETLFDEE